MFTQIEPHQPILTKELQDLFPNPGFQRPSKEQPSKEDSKSSCLLRLLCELQSVHLSS